MKSIFITTLFTLSAIFCYSQSFNGVNISGDVTTALQEFKSKGFKLVKQQDNTYQLSGLLGSKKVELYVYCTPITKKTAKFVVYFEEKTSFALLKSDFQDFHEIFIEKYGEPTHKLRKTDHEYDSYEAALRDEKIIISDYWLYVGGNLSISLSISKYMQLKMTYENDAIMDVLQKENKQQNLNIY
jgi:hypothetical protein